jgi:hypothetical protein
VTPLREGGSLPGLVEADDDGLYVLKFRGAGQGPQALVAELVAGELARALGLPVPELVLVELDPELGRAEPDPEIQELIEASGGVNLGVDFLPGALAFDPAAGAELGPELAADVVWFDALVTNVDRTPRNPNLLLWHRRTWLIDHGAALYVLHARDDALDRADDGFAAIAEHVLMPWAGSIADADARLAQCADGGVIASLFAQVPEAWLAPERRGPQAEYLTRRAAGPRRFVAVAEEARARA